jgi:hypothetical protein
MMGTGGTAPPVVPLRPGEPPLALLVDYDGTIALTDVSDMVMAEHVPGPATGLMATRPDGPSGPDLRDRR